MRSRSQKRGARITFQAGDTPIELEPRTFHCLNYAGYLDADKRLSDVMIRDVMAIQAFGARCLVDFLTTLEAHGHGGSDQDYILPPELRSLTTRILRLEGAKTRRWEKALSESDRIVAATLREHGPVMHRQRFEDTCVSKGMNLSTFSVLLTYSPLIERLAEGVYGLRGCAVLPGLVESLMPARRPGSRIVEDFGWEESGTAKIRYRLSKGAVRIGVLSVPSGISRMLQGRYSLSTADGSTVGEIVVKKTSAWGLKPFFRRRGGEAGDTLVIRFDVKRKTAVVELGGDSSEDPSADAAERVERC